MKRCALVAILAATTLTGCGSNQDPAGPKAVGGPASSGAPMSVGVSRATPASSSATVIPLPQTSPATSFAMRR